MRAVHILIRHLLYAVEHWKLRAAVIFYGFVAILLLQLSPSTHASPRISSATKSIALPYIEAVPHGPALETAASYTSGPNTVSAAPVNVPAGAMVWPLHGRVTTEFGASDYPYQSRHTGMDISSAHPSGAMAVVAFRGGTVVSVIHSYSGYGNHIIIDHGGGLTSLYGHLFSTSVSVGQQVSAGTPIGTEGDSGASTGTHLHFEIRNNGVPQNPRSYLTSNP